MYLIFFYYFFFIIFWQLYFRKSEKPLWGGNIWVETWIGITCVYCAHCVSFVYFRCCKYLLPEGYSSVNFIHGSFCYSVIFTINVNSSFFPFMVCTFFEACLEIHIQGHKDILHFIPLAFTLNTYVFTLLDVEGQFYFFRQKAICPSMIY